MNNSLKKELSLITAGLSIVASRNKSNFWSRALALTSAGLYLASLVKEFSFRGKKVLITGGSRGLGLSLAWNLLNSEAEVMLLARDESELGRAKDILLKDFPDGKVHTRVCDVTNAQQLSESIESAILTMDGVDLLINNAGAILVGPFTSMEMEDFEAQMRLHVYSVVQATQLIFAHFKTRGGGRILNICSLGGKTAIPHMIPYNTSKFALAGFSQGVAAELAQHNIILTTAYPTVMRTGSPIQAVFKGEHEKEFTWFETIDNLPGISMGADTAAKKVLDAVANGQSEVILSVPGKARVLMGSLFPEAMTALMALVNRILPSGDSTIRKTGADSASLFNQTVLLRPIQKRAKANETKYNQEPKHDAELNLGLYH